MRIIVGHQVEQAMQLQRIDTQARSQPPEDAVAIILDKVLRQCFAGGRKMLLGAAVGRLAQ